MTEYAAQRAVDQGGEPVTEPKPKRTEHTYRYTTQRLVEELGISLFPKKANHTYTTEIEVVQLAAGRQSLEIHLVEESSVA